MGDEDPVMPVGDNVTFENTYMQKPEEFGEVRPDTRHARGSRRRFETDKPDAARRTMPYHRGVPFLERTETCAPSADERSIVVALVRTETSKTRQGYKFMRGPVQKILTDTIKERLEGTQYDPLKSAQIAKELADTVKERVKNLGYERYKLVVQVTVGEKTGQALRLASRCLWDTATDNFASDFYENSSVFCVGMVFGLYYE